MSRRLPSPQETADILARRRTRPPRRPPPPAGKALSTYLKTLDERFGGAGPGPRLLRERWREIAGETLGRRTEPVKLVRARRGGGGGVLEVRVDGPAAALIQHQSAEIIARVNLALGEGAVERLRIIQGPVAAPKDAPARRPKIKPLDAAQEAELARSLAEAPDGGLKAALLRLGREVMRRD